MKICIIGTGYVGLVTGTCFAEIGHDVTCVDKDAAKVKLLQNGGMPIYEPGLPELVRKNVEAGRLRFTASTPEGVVPADVVFIAVPTPPQADGSAFDLQEATVADLRARMRDHRETARSLLDKYVARIEAALSDPDPVQAVRSVLAPLRLPTIPSFEASIHE